MTVQTGAVAVLPAANGSPALRAVRDPAVPGAANPPARRVTVPPDLRVMRTFLSHLDLRERCWPWQGSRNDRGYPYMTVRGRTIRAHRVAFELFFGPIPDGLTIDHLCHNADLSCPGGVTCVHRRCVNPFHLGAVSNTENNRRAKAPRVNKTHCVNGHPVTPDNTRITADGKRRRCRPCERFSSRRHYYEVRGLPVPPTG